MIIEFVSDGYEDSGQLLGPPEDCYPPEGSDERTLVRAYIETDDATILLSAEQQSIIFESYTEAVYDADMDYDDRDCDDKDRYDEYYD